MVNPESTLASARFVDAIGRAAFPPSWGTVGAFASGNAVPNVLFGAGGAFGVLETLFQVAFAAPNGCSGAGLVGTLVA